MDLLIQLLVWLFRTLFGEVEQPPDEARGERPVRPPRRGPYVYGDEPPGQAKTLEEILEEVRQAAAMKSGERQAESAEPRAPSRARQQAASPAPRVPRPAPRNRPPPVARPAEPEVAQPGPVGRVGNPPYEELVTLKASSPSIKDSLLILPAGPEPMSMTGAAAGAEPLAAVSVVPELVSRADAAAELAKSAAARPAGLPVGIAGLLEAILRATPEQKRDVARQAIVLHEVFGPPRCRRPHRAGSRAF